MSRNRPDVETRVEDLSRRLRDVENRLVALESAGHRPGDSYGTAEAVEHGAGSVEEAAGPSPRTEILPLIGRTLLVLAGAFLLRALTESGTLPQSTGTAVGIGYAILWLVMAERAARGERMHGATFHGLAAALIAFPLLWEATIKFGFLSPTASAGVLLVFTGIGLGVATVRRLPHVAWIVATGAAATAVALAVPTRMLVLFSALLLVLGLATLWLGYLRGWSGLGWTIAVVADVSILVMTLMVLAGREEQVREVLRPGSLVVLQLALVLAYCGSLGIRTLAHGREVDVAEIAQGAASLVLGLGGALAVAHEASLSQTPTGVVSAILATACYGAAFAFIDRRSGSRMNFIFYTTLALVFTLTSLEALLGGFALSAGLSVLAVASAWLGASRQRATLSLHGAVYAIAAAITSGLIDLAVESMVAPQPPAIADVTPAAVMALGVLAACAWLPVAAHRRTWGRFSQAPKLAVLVVLLLGIDGLLVALGTALITGNDPSAVDAGALAALRTATLAVTTLFVAWCGRFERFAEARWLVYPLLIGGGAKLLLEDMAAGRAATLVLSFALYGGALIVAPRLARRSVQG